MELDYCVITCIVDFFNMYLSKDEFTKKYCDYLEELHCDYNADEIIKSIDTFEKKASDYINREQKETPFYLDILLYLVRMDIFMFLVLLEYLIMVLHTYLEVMRNQYQNLMIAIVVSKDVCKIRYVV